MHIVTYVEKFELIVIYNLTKMVVRTPPRGEKDIFGRSCQVERGEGWERERGKR